MVTGRRMWKNWVHREPQDDSMTDFIDASGFRANVGIVLVRGKGEVFLGGRTGGRGWQFPQGGIGRDEDPEAGMFRELREEVGLEPGDVRIIASTTGWLRYRLPAQTFGAMPSRHASARSSAGSCLK